MFKKNTLFLFLIFLWIAQPAISLNHFESYIDNAQKLMGSLYRLFCFLGVDTENIENDKKTYTEASKAIAQHTKRINDPTFFPSSIEQEKQRTIINLHRTFEALEPYIWSCFMHGSGVSIRKSKEFTFLVNNKNFYKSLLASESPNR